MNRAVLSAAFCAFFPLAGSSVYAQTRGANTSAPAATVSPADKRFIGEATQVNLMAITMGNSAEERGTTPAVKDFGRDLAHQHAAANQQLEQVAHGLGLVPPTAITARNRTIMGNLDRKSGTQFDTAFLNQTIRDQNAALNIFRREAQTGTNPELRQYAANMVTSLENHVAESRNVLSTLPPATTTSTSSSSATVTRHGAAGRAAAGAPAAGQSTVQYGTVTGFQPGQRLEVKLRGTTGTQVFDLANMAANIGPGIGKGTQVRITQYTDANGAHHITVEPSAPQR